MCVALSAWREMIFSEISNPNKILLLKIFENAPFRVAPVF